MFLLVFFIFRCVFATWLKPNDLYTWLKGGSIKDHDRSKLNGKCVLQRCSLVDEKEKQMKVKAFGDPFFNHFRVTVLTAKLPQSWWQLNRWCMYPLQCTLYIEMEPIGWQTKSFSTKSLIFISIKCSSPTHISVSIFHSIFLFAPFSNEWPMITAQIY